MSHCRPRASGLPRGLMMILGAATELAVIAVTSLAQLWTQACGLLIAVLSSVKLFSSTCKLASPQCMVEMHHTCTAGSALRIILEAADTFPTRCTHQLTMMALHVAVYVACATMLLPDSRVTQSLGFVILHVPFAP